MGLMIGTVTGIYRSLMGISWGYQWTYDNFQLEFVSNGVLPRLTKIEW